MKTVPNKIKVALVIPSLIIGGSQRMVCELIRNLDYDTFEVYLHCFQSGNSDSFLNAIEKTPAHLRIHGPYEHFGFKALCSLSHSLSKDSPDVIHAHLGGIQASMPWSILHSKKTIVTLHSTMPAALNGTALKLVKAAGKNRVQLVAVSTNNLIQAQSYLGAGFPNMIAINNGVTLEDYYQCDLRSAPRFINVATQDDNKNQALIINAFKKLQVHTPDARLVLVGDGPRHNKLIEMAQGNDAISIVGSSDRVPELLSEANVYVQSSNREGMPLAILEALASGMPVISTNVGGISDVVNPHCSVLVEPGRENQMLDAMIELSDRDTRLKLGEAARSRAEAFSAALMASKYESLYLEAQNDA